VSRGAWTRKLTIVEEHEGLPTPVRIGAIADTHQSPDRRRPGIAAALALFRRAGVDCILHAGDVGDATLLDTLADIAPVFAVRGNADSRVLLDRLPDRIWFQSGGRRLLLTHGHHGKTARQTVQAIASPEVDLIVFGHSHQPLIEVAGQTILFNPGSPVERRWNPHFGVGIIDVSDDEIAPELILFDDPADLEGVIP
jgi:putative phosphoesterase